VELAAPRRRPARPVGEAPIEALAADAERLAKGWLLAVIELLPLAEAAGAVGGGWASGAPRVCSGAVRALGSDEALARLGPAGELAGSLDELRAVLWSALRSAWPTAEPDQVWALGERLAVVIEALRGTGNAAPAWPDAVEPAVASALATGEPLALLLAELVDAGRMVSIEPEFPEVMARFLAAVEGAAGAGRVMVGDGEGRAWVIAAGADRGRAEALASRIAAAVREAPPWRGAPLVASVGVAVLGEDGEDVAGLIEAAEQAMLGVAARGGGA
jgi:hypothetical protein